MINKLKPIFILFGAISVSYILWLLGQVQPDPVEDVPPPDVIVQILTPENFQVTINSTGTTEPLTQTVLNAEVGGEVVYRSKKFSEGSSVLSGEILAKIDDTDLQLKYKNALLQLANAEVQYSLQVVESEVAKEAWEKLGEGQASDLTLQKPQLKQAEALIEVAKAQVNSAEKKLNKTEIVAPYSGRIQSANIDIGTTIIPGQPIGAMYTSSEIEVTLSVKDNDLQFLSIPMDGRKLNPSEQAKVTISSFYKGQNQEWEGKLERVDGVIDPVTRMINLIAVFKNDFIEIDKPNLPIGLFVEAQIDGVILQNVFIIPISAISENNEVFVINKNNQLQSRSIKVLKKYNKFIIAKDNLKAGERLVTTKLSTASDGITVNPIYQ
ncbi:MAG: efflux RND transporter periplasmic adaptor subunit [Candidatus Pelagibacter sp. TMED118]|nr:MAG: efflux RND transporter periplasmic adaptor subunit [Candidatus Pelagibacter sp. TMED118]|tara:strand:- start:6204 stop:7346 length:1143 start_codon:yes stop_codon:yes gene_type:complete